MQLKKTDEVGERISGLTPLQALEYLEEQSRAMFTSHFRAARMAGFGTNTASKIASDMTTGLLGNLYQQIDPIRVAENFRFLSIAEHYGKRVARNLKQGALDKLVRSYPSHDFVIDPTEARELFEMVEKPKPSLAHLGTLLKPLTEQFLYGNDAQFCYISAKKSTVLSSDSPIPQAVTTNSSSTHAPSINISDAHSEAGVHAPTG